jgi:hypothetical protein
MSSIMDAGYYADQASREKDSKCKKGGKHKWKVMQGGPSKWEKCVKCGKNIYWK